MIGTKKRTMKQALTPYKVEVGPARCPNCKKVVGIFRRSMVGLVCRDCHLPQGWPV